MGDRALRVRGRPVCFEPGSPSRGDCKQGSSTQEDRYCAPGLSGGRRRLVRVVPNLLQIESCVAVVLEALPRNGPPRFTWTRLASHDDTLDWHQQPIPAARDRLD